MGEILEESLMVEAVMWAIAGDQETADKKAQQEHRSTRCSKERKLGDGSESKHPSHFLNWSLDRSKTCFKALKLTEKLQEYCDK